MKKKMIAKMIAPLAAVLLMMGGCGKEADATKPAEVTTIEPAVEEPAASTDPAAEEPEKTADKEAETTPEATPEAESGTGRQDGERFEDVIILEGMEETVQYEHAVNDAIGMEIDFDYESFTRKKDGDKESFISVYDNADAPENYLEIVRDGQDAASAADAVGEELSKKYEISRSDFELDHAGTCIRIDASADVGGKTMPDQLQMVYIIPAGDGCIIATAHYAIEAAEGFGRRFAYMMHTLVVK